MTETTREDYKFGEWLRRLRRRLGPPRCPGQITVDASGFRLDCARSFGHPGRHAAGDYRWGAT